MLEDARREVCLGERSKQSKCLPVLCGLCHGAAAFPGLPVHLLGCSRSLLLQPVIRLYAVPFSAFTGEEEDEEGAASEVEVEP